MPDCMHVWREKRALEKLHKEEERAERLRQLDPERANTSGNHGEEERYPGVYESESEPHPREHAALPGAVPPSPGSTTW